MKKIIEKAKKIKLLATDIDGVWTDACMYYTEEGDHMKAFSTYDGMAVSMLKKKNIIIAILTSENTNIVIARAKKLNIEEVYINENEKLKRLQYLAQKYEIKMEQIAFIGDDINDIDALNAVGLSALTNNSPIKHLLDPDYITSRTGGKGAFREFSDLILNSK